MIDVKDRVPSQVLSNGAIRYEEFDTNGNSLGYKYIKRADEPIEPGTPINKALFDKIDGLLKKELGERSRIDRYNAPIVSDDIGEVLNYDNLFSGEWTGGTGGGSADAYKGSMRVIPEYSAYDSAGHIKNIFNSSGWQSRESYKKREFYIDMSESVEILKFKLSRSCSSFVSFIINGSNSIGNWINLYSSTENTSGLDEIVEITLQNTAKYRYYEFIINVSSTRATVMIANLQVVSSKQSANKLLLSNDISNYFNGQRFLIQTPTLNYDRAMLNVNGLGDISIKEKLDSNTKYELVYNDSSFNAYSVESDLEKIKQAIISLGGVM